MTTGNQDERPLTWLDILGPFIMVGLFGLVIYAFRDSEKHSPFYDATSERVGSYCGLKLIGSDIQVLVPVPGLACSMIRGKIYARIEVPAWEPAESPAWTRKHSIEGGP